jgi:hypothetical protein
MHRQTPKHVMESLSPLGRPSTVKDIAEAVLYLTDAATVTGHILLMAARISATGTRKEFRHDHPSACCRVTGDRASAI